MSSKYNLFSLQIIIILSTNVIGTKYGTGLNSIIYDPNGVYDSAHLSITIDSITDKVELLIVRELGSNSRSSILSDVSQSWLGIGFSTDDSYTSGHSGVYSIIADADGDFGEQSLSNKVEEYALSKYNKGYVYTVPEITVTSDIYSELGRNITITRPRIGTFTFPLFPQQLDSNNEYQMAIIAAFGIAGDYSIYSHKRDSYSRNLKILTFSQLPATTTNPPETTKNLPETTTYSDESTNSFSTSIHDLVITNSDYMIPTTTDESTTVLEQAFETSVTIDDSHENSDRNRNKTRDKFGKGSGDGNRNRNRNGDRESDENESGNGHGDRNRTRDRDRNRDRERNRNRNRTRDRDRSRDRHTDRNKTHDSDENIDNAAEKHGSSSITDDDYRPMWITIFSIIGLVAVICGIVGLSYYWNKGKSKKEHTLVKNEDDISENENDMVLPDTDGNTELTDIKEDGIGEENVSLKIVR